MHIGTHSMNNVTKIRAAAWLTTKSTNMVTLTAENDDALIIHHFHFENSTAGRGIARKFFEANGGKPEEQDHHD